MAAIFGEPAPGESSFKASFGVGPLSDALYGWDVVHFIGLALAYYTITESILKTSPGKRFFGLVVVRTKAFLHRMIQMKYIPI